MTLRKEIQGAEAPRVDDATPGAEALPAGGAMTGVGDMASVILVVDFGRLRIRYFTG